MEFFEDEFDQQEDKRIGKEVSLDSIIKQLNNGELIQGYDDCQEFYILYKVCQLLANIHSNSQNHGSIRLSNILLDERYSPRVTKSTFNNVNSAQSKSIEYVVSLSPETIFKQELTAESDIYSFGIMILQVLTRQINIFSEYSNDIYVINELIKNGVKPSVTSEKIPLILTNILSLCFSQNKTKRPSAKMIQSILAKILTEKRYERQIQEIKNRKHKKIPKKSKNFKRGALFEIDIPPSLSTIRSNAFSDLSSFKIIRIPSSETDQKNIKKNDILSRNHLPNSYLNRIQMNSDTPSSVLLGIKEDDINTVMQQCNVSRDHAIEALQEANGDLVAAVMNLAL